MRKSIKLFLSVFFVFLVAIIIGIASLPFWLSSSHGKKTALKWVNARIDGSFSIEKMELNWLGPQRFENIQLKDKEGKVHFSCLTFETNTSLLYMLFGGRTLGRTFIETPYVVLPQKMLEKEKTEEIDKKSGKSKKKERPALPKFDDSVIVTDGTLIFPTKDASSPITVSGIQVDKTVSPNHIVLKATTAKGHEQGWLRIDAEWEQMRHANIHIENFPVEIIDSLTSSHMYSEALGQSLNIDCHIEKKSQDVLVVQGSAAAPHLTLEIEGTLQKDRFFIDPKSHVDFMITPSFFKQLISKNRRGNWELASKTQLNIQIEKGIIPITEPIRLNEVVLQAHAHLNRAEMHHVSLGSYSLNHFDVTATTHNHLNINYQGEIQGREASKISGNAAMTPEGNLLFDYVCQSFPVTLLELISSDLEKNVRFILGNNFDLKGKGTYASEELDTELSIDSSDAQLNAHLTGNLPEINFDLSGTHQIHGSKAKVLGSSVNLVLSGAAKLQAESFVLPFIKGRVFNSYVDLEVSGQIGEEGKTLALDQIQLLAFGNIKKLPLEETLTESALQNGLLFLQIDGSKNLIIGKAESKALEARFEVAHFIQNEALSFSNARIDFTCNLHEFPVAVASPFLSENVDLTAFLGKSLSLTSKGSYRPDQEPRFVLDLNGQGEGLRTSLSISLDHTLTVKQNRPSFIYWEMTPERYEALMRQFRLDSQIEPTFVLKRTTPIELNINQLTCPTAPTETLGRFFCQSGFVGDLSIGTTEFRSRQTQESITFQGVSGSIKGENFSKAVDIDLKGKIQAPNIPRSEESTFSFAGQMLNFWTPEGKFNREALTVKGQLSLDLLPVRQIAGMFPLDHETRSIVQAVLGELVNARISGEISQLSGPVTVDIKSSNFKALIPLELKKTAFYLRDYVNAEITLTPAVNETLLKEINPLIIAGAYSDHPIKVYIDPNGFVLPIRPYSLEKIQIANAVVDIGKIMVKNGGQIQSLLQFLNAKEITPEGFMEAWFTPIFLNLHHGVATYKRFDALLARNVHIALWGNINLISEQVDMTLAVAPTTLYERFKIAGLKKEDMFQVKMRGTTTKLDLDWSSAYSRVAWIVARASAGYLSDILGGILEQLVSNLGDDPVPPPTTDPLPWER
jgi:hypothetical protein